MHNVQGTADQVERCAARWRPRRSDVQEDSGLVGCALLRRTARDGVVHDVSHLAWASHAACEA